MIKGISFTTIRIEAIFDDSSKSYGTAFFYQDVIEEDQAKQVIVSNRHVFEGATAISFYFCISDSDGNIVPCEKHKITITDFQSIVKYHPNPNIDLAILPFHWIYKLVCESGVTPFFKFLDSRTILDTFDVPYIGDTEDILMIGYPNGLWDQVNNLPLVRKGITATPPHVDWLGERQFVIDCACFPGSSGSPILIYQKGMVPSGDGTSVSPGNRIIFAGVLFAGPLFNIDGEVEIVEIPTKQVPIARIQLMMNLGYCIKAQVLKEFVASLP